ncbi:hypothetical protein GOBAR_DD13577 [Gossypium barbadense]|nr:hypothetical protein GOBAR_DD13577 [Gossypium barbadense]
MFKNTFQSGFLSILYSLGSKPLQIWDKEVENGHVKRPHDDDIQSNVLEIIGSNIQSTFITCPADPAATLGIKLPFLVMIVKNLKKYFSFEIQVLDDKNVRRRFRASNFQLCIRKSIKVVNRELGPKCSLSVDMPMDWRIFMFRSSPLLSYFEIYDNEQRVWLEAIIMCPLSIIWTESMKTSFGTSEAIISNLSVLHGLKMCCHSAV